MNSYPIFLIAALMIGFTPTSTLACNASDLHQPLPSPESFQIPPLSTFVPEGTHRMNIHSQTYVKLEATGDVYLFDHDIRMKELAKTKGRIFGEPRIEARLIEESIEPSRNYRISLKAGKQLPLNASLVPSENETLQGIALSPLSTHFLVRSHQKIYIWDRATALNQKAIETSQAKMELLEPETIVFAEFVDESHVVTVLTSGLIRVTNIGDSLNGTPPREIQAKVAGQNGAFTCRWAPRTNTLLIFSNEDPVIEMVNILP